MTMHAKFGITAVAQATIILALSGCGGGNDAGTGAGASGAAAPQGAASLRQAQAATSTATSTATTTAASTEPANLVVRASATLALDAGPVMQLRVDGKVVASAEVRAANYQNYSFNVPTIAPGAKVDVVFNVDLVANGNDRNLFVESVTINGTTVAANATGVTFDRGAGAKAFDGQDVLPGLGTLWWNGALRFTAPAAAASARLSPACTAFYAARPAFALNIDRTVPTVPALGRPAKGTTFADPNYGTCLTRATDHAAEGLSRYARTEYSRRQMFNADNTKQLIVAGDGYYHLYDANTHALLKKLPSFGVDPELQWHPTNPDLIYLMPHQGSELKQKEMNVATGAVRVVGDFAARLGQLFPGTQPSHAYTKAEGSPSKDGRYWCYLVRDASNSTNGSWASVGVFTWDRDTDTIVGSMRMPGGQIPDHVSMSATGDYCVVSSDGSVGTTAYSRDFSQSRKLLDSSVHSDLALDANGDDVLVYIDSTNYGDVYMTHLRTGTRTPLLSGIRTAAHFSGKAFAKPGWVVLTTQATWAGSAPQWVHNKVMAVQLKPNPVIYNLAMHRSLYNGGDTAPTASVNRDFTRIAFNSNWNVNSPTDVDTYTIEIPAGLLKDGTGPVPPTTPNPPTPEPPAPQPPQPASLDVVLAGPVTRDAYLVKYTAKTSVPAKCGSAWTPGNPFAWLYDFLTPSADGLAHEATVYLDSATAARTIYLVCKANDSDAEKELAIQVK